MATVRVEPPFARPLYLRAERLVMAGCSRWLGVAEICCPSSSMQAGRRL